MRYVNTYYRRQNEIYRSAKYYAYSFDKDCFYNQRSNRFTDTYEYMAEENISYSIDRSPLTIKD